MNKTVWLSLLLGCGFVASAQTKVSGAVDCGASNPSYSIPLPDRPGVVFTLGQNKCNWTKSIGMEGLEAKEFASTAFGEVGPKAIRTTASGVTTYTNGDKAFTRAQGTTDAQTGAGSGKWTYQSGTGKLKGVRGGGSFTCKLKGADPSAGYTCDVEGEYTLGAAKK